MSRALPAPIRRYFIRLGISMTIYVPALIVATYLARHHGVHGVTLWLLALLPGLAIVGAFYAIGMLIVETKDEFMRMLIVRQVLYGTAITLSFATIWGFLENFDLVPHIAAFYWALVWLVGFGLGGAINRLTLGTSGSCA